MTASSYDEYSALLSAAASTAGCDNWKTHAGRLNGPDGFLFGDLFRCMEKSVIRNVIGVSKPSRCPVCMEDPTESDGSTPPNRWYFTKSCNHAVCMSCLRSYASSLISNPNHLGPLKCPCCPRLLLIQDAKVALSNIELENKGMISRKMRESSECDGKDSIVNFLSVKKKSYKDMSVEQDLKNTHCLDRSSIDILLKWDVKVRDGLLRSMPDFRPCPYCTKCQDAPSVSTIHVERTQDTQLHGNIGGGFVTPECLYPINQERERFAELTINMAGKVTVNAVILAYSTFYFYSSQRYSNREEYVEHMNRAAVSFQIAMTILVAIIVPVMPHFLRLLLAKIARAKMIRPIIVGCPCCKKEFNLDASSELKISASNSNSTSESASQHWKSINTRPCPGCSSPILKDGGCNHVRCGRCHADFCWACMRTRTKCRAYQCKNGAPYGNAFVTGSPEAAVAGLLLGGREGRTLMEHIDFVESEAIRNLHHCRIIGTFISRLLIGAVVSSLLINISNNANFM